MLWYTRWYILQDGIIFMKAFKLKSYGEVMIVMMDNPDRKSKIESQGGVGGKFKQYGGWFNVFLVLSLSFILVVSLFTIFYVAMLQRDVYECPTAKCNKHFKEIAASYSNSPPLRQSEGEKGPIIEKLAYFWWCLCYWCCRSNCIYW